MLIYALLGFLNYCPMTGYELKQFMDDSTAFFWHARLSQIYTTLKKMEVQGLVESEVEPQEDRPDRRVYTITEGGQQMLREWLETPLTELQPHKEHLLLKFFFSAQIDKDTLLTQLRLKRKLHQDRLAVYQEDTHNTLQQIAGNSPEIKKDVLLWEATIRYGILFEEMSIKWLNEQIENIERHFD